MTAHDHRVRIISHPLCPFARRLGLVLAAKGWRRDRDYRLDYVDLAAMPSWFIHMSPGGAMPATEIEPGIVILDGGDAMARLDALDGPSLQPRTLHARIRHEEAVAEVDGLLLRLRDVFTARESSSLIEATDALFGALARTPLSPRGDRFDERFGRVDAAYAPFFWLVTFFPALRDDERWAAAPALWAWGQRLLELPAMRQTACPDPEHQFAHFFALNRSAFVDRVEAA